jgi:hypothetical protein
VLHTSPGLEDIWQLHWSSAAGLEQNSPGLFIANIEEPANMAALLTRVPGGGRQGAGPGPGLGGPPQAPPAGVPGTPGTPGTPAGAPGAPPPGGRGGGFGGGRGGHTGPAFWIKVSAQADGSFTVTNTRNNFSKTYGARK